MKCPNCGVQAPAGATDCAGCGVVFAKFLAQREREKKAAADFLELKELPQAVPANYRNLHIAAGVVLAIWFAGLLWYYVNTLNEREERIQSELRARSRAAALAVPPP